MSQGEIPTKAARYVPPPPGADLEARLRDLIVWMQADHIDPVVAAAMGHCEFEALHPFHDGNGRLGRLLIVLQAVRVRCPHRTDPLGVDLVRGPPDGVLRRTARCLD